MKRERFSVEQIVGILKQAEVGVPVAEVIRKAGIAEQTFYRWKKQYIGLEVDQVRQRKPNSGRERTIKAVGGGTEPGQDHAPGGARKKVIKPSRARTGRPGSLRSVSRQ